MAISRMQQPRQLYGLGSLVKSIGKGVKNLIKSPVGKGLLLAGGFGLAGMGPFAGLGKTALGTRLFGTPGIPDAIGKEGLFSSLIEKFKGAGTGTKLGVGSGLVSLLLADGFSGDEVKAITQDKVAVSKYLRDYYTKLNPDADETEIQEFVETNTSEYATGGRVGLKDSVKFMTEKELEETMPGLARGEVKNYELKKKANRMEKLMELLKEYEKNKKAAGGMPTGIMRTNQAGVRERDYRDEGGFVPVGIKERADDVPAMLSKNEFVMTADAVRGAGNGSIEKGAQRMYDQMKNLESKVA